MADQYNMQLHFIKCGRACCRVFLKNTWRCLNQPRYFSVKLNALSRVAKFMCPKKARLIMNTFFLSTVQLLFSHMDVSL